MDTSNLAIKAVLPQHIDSTMISTFRACPRKFYYEFILGLRPAGFSINLHAGACFSAALETLYTKTFAEQLSPDDALKYAIQTLLIEWGDAPLAVKGNPKTRDRMLEAIIDYNRVYPPRLDHVQPYIMPDGRPSVEYTFAIPLDDPGFPLHPVTGDPFVYCGRFDLLGVYMKKKPVVKDDKTTKQAGDSWADQWNLRSQLIGYVWGCQRCGIDLDSVVVRGVVIQVKELRQLEALKFYPPHLVSTWYEQLKRDLNRLVQMWNDDYYDYDLAESCTSFGKCAFMDLDTSEHPETWYPTFATKRWNPLQRDPLKEPINV